MRPYSSPRAGRAIALGAASCLLLVACGGGGSGDDGGGDGSPATDGTDPTAEAPREPAPSARHGTVVVEERKERFHLDAWFLDAAAPPAGADALDVCTLRSEDATVGPSAPPPARLSAGDALEITTRGGTWASLERQVGGVETVYATELRSVREAWPDDALLSVPGDEFPAVGPIALGPVLSLELLAPEGTRDLPSDRTVRWTPGDDPRDRIVLVLRERDAGGTEGSRVDVLCTLADDGEFVVPADAVPFERPWLSRAARVRETRTEVEPGTVLVVEQLSER